MNWFGVCSGFVLCCCCFSGCGLLLDFAVNSVDLGFLCSLVFVLFCA